MQPLHRTASPRRIGRPSGWPAATRAVTGSIVSASGERSACATANPSTALLALTVPYVWRTLPFAILLVHAALQGINPELYEAADIDGAGPLQRFWHITLPLLTPIIVVILVLRTSFAFAVFEEVLAITQGGPGDATWVAAWYAYKKSFAPPFDIGVGAASLSRPASRVSPCTRCAIRSRRWRTAWD